MAEGTPRSESIFTGLAQRVADACRRMVAAGQPVVIDSTLPPHLQQRQVRGVQVEQRQAHLAAVSVLDAGRDAYAVALRDPNLSRSVDDPYGRPIGRLLTPAGADRVLGTGLIPDETVRAITNGAWTNVAAAREMLARGGSDADRFASDFTVFMHSFSPSRAAQSQVGPAAIQQVCTVVEPVTPPRTPQASPPANPHRGEFGQPPKR
ncbi:MAG: hypothetical protein K2Q12_06875 [Rickettsiales bacterium]|nr:hypothetical protein [Rickettsiales bacterium]